MALGQRLSQWLGLGGHRRARNQQVAVALAGGAFVRVARGGSAQRVVQAGLVLEVVVEIVVGEASSAAVGCSRVVSP